MTCHKFGQTLAQGAGSPQTLLVVTPCLLGESCPRRFQHQRSYLRSPLASLMTSSHNPLVRINLLGRFAHLSGQTKPAAELGFDALTYSRPLEPCSTLHVYCVSALQ